MTMSIGASCSQQRAAPSRRRCRARRSTAAAARRGPRPPARRACVERVGLDVEVAVLDPPVDPRLVALDADHDAVVHGDGERLGAAHAAEPGGQRDRAGQRAAEPTCRRPRRTSRRCPAGCPGCRCRSTSRRSSGRTSSARGPRAGGTPPSWPSRRPGWSWRSAPAAPTRGCASRRPACRDCTSIVSSSSSVAQRAHERVVRLPVAGRLAGAAVDDEVLGTLGVLRVEVVHQHPQRRLGLPRPRGQLGAVGGVDGQPRVGRSSCSSPITSSTACTTAPERTSSTAVSISGDEVAVGAGALDAGRRAAAGRRRRWPATARAARAGRAPGRR